MTLNMRQNDQRSQASGDQLISQGLAISGDKVCLPRDSVKSVSVWEGGVLTLLVHY